MKNFSTSGPLFSKNLSLNLGGTIMDLSTPRVMGIINTTPDSFYDASRVPEPWQAVETAREMIGQGVDILDVGAISSRPGSEEVSEEEESGELAFEAALGAKGQDLSAYRLKMGEGVAGWVAQKGKPAIVNDTARDRRFTPRYDAWTQFATRSILCAPLVSRGRTIGVLEIINKRDGRFTSADLDLVLTLVEPCAIALENAILFQRTEDRKSVV